MVYIYMVYIHLYVYICVFAYVYIYMKEIIGIIIGYSLINSSMAGYEWKSLESRSCSAHEAGFLSCSSVNTRNSKN